MKPNIIHIRIRVVFQTEYYLYPYLSCFYFGPDDYNYYNNWDDYNDYDDYKTMQNLQSILLFSIGIVASLCCEQRTFLLDSLQNPRVGNKIYVLQDLGLRPHMRFVI